MPTAETFRRWSSLEGRGKQARIVFGLDKFHNVTGWQAPASDLVLQDKLLRVRRPAQA